ncbi:NitT/TauT family transport system substrate-binding protein [Herbinix hemicellulosilytica]|uniref:Putative binding protein YtlA n=1 Tax=Herbinix hemicellulosilytica TaxID=1564487 RepID=A0A0H5SFL9_HERHM|nr:ABC transporter substrate-binding protein [Herbinix hemicellulosilytica]RBP60106.1 NitT/TauT family transport system substrate-binding protein [Herbinix hemicellulosilytica]CRZ33830.1 putative binding protein YtlA [Herbinix hemicellulosilytica]
MKRKFIIVLALVFLAVLTMAGCKKEDELIEITLNEVAHSIFYAPMYVAFEEGYFEEEGLKVNLVNGLGADKTMTALLSGECEIGFMGAEASIYVYNQGAEDYVVNFAQLTQRAGNFLVSRDLNEDFKWENLKGKTVLGGRKGGMPQMVFEYILKNKGIDPQKDLNIIQNIDFGLTSQAFASGQGDYTIEFEPAATALELEGVGKVVASLGIESGKVPYTSFSARKSYIEKHPDIIQKFTNAIQKGMDYVQSHTPEEIAKAISGQFKETDEKTLVLLVTRYYEQETWKENLIFEEESLDLLQDILELAGELDKRVPYESIVTTEFAKNALSK